MKSSLLSWELDLWWGKQLLFLHQKWKLRKVAENGKWWLQLLWKVSSWNLNWYFFLCSLYWIWFVLEYLFFVKSSQKLNRFYIIDSKNVHNCCVFSNSFIKVSHSIAKFNRDFWKTTAIVYLQRMKFNLDFQFLKKFLNFAWFKTSLQKILINYFVRIDYVV